MALAVDRGALRRLATGRRVVLVTGTNGKTIVAHLIAGVLGQVEPVAHNDTGANMADGAVAALMARPQARLAVLEVDELHLAAVAEQVQPAAVVLLNLTCDQLDRSTEVAAVAGAIRRALQRQPEASVIANGDDPVIVAIADGVPGAQWVAAGATWTGDAALCPRCGRPLHRASDAWDCPGCGLRRPEPDWRLDDGVACGPGAATPLVVQLPGEYNRRNGLTAVAAAAALGIAPVEAAAAVAEVRSVAHRYAVVQRGGQRMTLLLAKNPAGWRQILPLLDAADGLLLGRVVDGIGNGDGTDGVFTPSVIGTYLHGPILVRNPGLADLLLHRATA